MIVVLPYSRDDRLPFLTYAYSNIPSRPGASVSESEYLAVENGLVTAQIEGPAYPLNGGGWASVSLC